MKRKSVEELGDELCNWCPLEENQKGAHSTPNGVSLGCEGSHCSEAYDAYLDSIFGE